MSADEQKSDSQVQSESNNNGTNSDIENQEQQPAVIKSEPVVVKEENKSSLEILSELFSTFNADPPVIVKKEKEDGKKHKKSKKKHKHKDKKHKSKKRKQRSLSHSSTSSDNSAVDLTDILIKTEKNDESYFSETLKKIINIDSIIKTEKQDVEVKAKDVKDIKVKLEEKKTEEKKKNSKKKKRKHEDDDSDGRERKKAKHKSKSSSKKRESSIEIKTKKHERDKSKDKHKSDESKHSHRDDYYKYKEYEEERRHRHKDTHRERSEDRFYRNDKYRDRDRRRERSREREDDQENHIDKKKLLEIARKNAIQMMKSGSLPGTLNLGPQAQEKVIAAIRSGGKTVEELTDFCKTLSRKEEMLDLSSVSEDGSESEADQPFHHPFQIKDKPLTINIKAGNTLEEQNSVPLPVKSNQERASELRIQFPVSSGQQHRKTESEWVPVSPKKPEPVKPPAPIVTTVQTPAFTVTVTTSPPAVVTETVAVTTTTSSTTTTTTTTSTTTATPGPQVYPTSGTDSPENVDNIDIASIVTQRLSAMRKLQENPNDVQAISEMYQAQKEMNTWAESKLQIGQFTGSTGAQILTQAELSSGYQAWARKDQLQTAAPVSGGMGMHLLQKMGWKPGEGLGKEKTGTLEPLLLEVKLDKKGIVAKEEQKKRATKAAKQVVKTLQGKHPVSLLGEYASKRKLGAPEYLLDFECGPDHKKNFLFKVILNGVQYKPNVASGNKKEAKAMAAVVCLQQLGLLP